MSAARRELVGVLAGCVLGAVLLLVAGARPWASVARPAPFHGAVAVSGTALTPLPAAAGLLGLAAVAGLLATRRNGRVAVGALLALVAAGTVAAAVQATGRHAVLAAAALTAPGAAPALTAWRWVAVAGAVVLVAAGAAAAGRGRHWPAMGARYDGPRARPAPATDEHEILWQALDRGEDPTG